VPASRRHGTGRLGWNGSARRAADDAESAGRRIRRAAKPRGRYHAEKHRGTTLENPFHPTCANALPRRRFQTPAIMNYIAPAAVAVPEVP